jgi:hypothetical protein
MWYWLLWSLLKLHWMKVGIFHILDNVSVRLHGTNVFGPAVNNFLNSNEIKYSQFVLESFLYRFVLWVMLISSMLTLRLSRILWFIASLNWTQLTTTQTARDQYPIALPWISLLAKWLALCIWEITRSNLHRRPAILTEICFGAP